MQIQARWIMGEDMSLPPVPVPGPGEPGQAILAELAQLVTDCTQLHPAHRPSFRVILDRLRPLSGAASMASHGSGPL